ncbi:hypothetical protein RR42_s0666 [Cupriavidus basilensis]|uniref:Uncharacterized protein n=1 Tax=Cupriavidus basilensis TaxID=68895 RepID=A0A0C4Y9V6_9BURK|nr:hypothetical protein RR42_s0666 [Cupriavidus basilensis]
MDDAIWVPMVIRARLIQHDAVIELFNLVLVITVNNPRRPLN